MEIMVDSFDFSVVWSSFGVLMALVIFGICVYYVVVKPSLDSTLLAVGSFIHLLTSLFYIVGVMVLSKIYDVDFYSSSIYSIVGGVGVIGTLCFTVGIVILITNYITLQKEQSMQKQF